MKRFRTYGVELDSHAEAYAKLSNHMARLSNGTESHWPRRRFPVYDEAIRRLGGDLEAGRPRTELP